MCGGSDGQGGWAPDAWTTCARAQNLATTMGHGPTTNSVNAEEPTTPPRNRIKFPKYEERKATEIKEYLSLFEDIAQQNRYSRDDWLIHLRVAFSGSKLEKAFSGCASYDEAKREVLLAHGLTADKVWRDAKSITQLDESFHHYVTRVARLLDSWIELTSTANAEAEDDEAPDVLAVLVKQLALDGLPAEMKAFLIERKCFHMDMPTFQATGVSYQEAHGRRKAAEKRPVAPPVQHSAQCLGVSVEQAKKDRAKMGKTYDRRAYVRNEKLCYLCLRGGHLAEQCQANTGCSKCDGKHHTLLHGKPKPKPAKDRDESISTYSCTTSAPVHLMTAVAEVCAKKRARVRVFLDPGSQASFISSSLAAAISPKCVGIDQVKVTAFGNEPVVQRMERLEVAVTGTSGPIKVHAWKNDNMSMRFPPVAKATICQWKASGINLSDQPGEGTSNDVHLLIGADHCNDILLQKRVVNGNTAWETEIGWVLSGPTKDAELGCTVSVACIEARVERLWQLKEPPSVTSHQPEFPIEQVGTQYQVGLLWRSDRRPPENYTQAMAAATKLMDRLNVKGKRQQYDNVLMREYSELGAIEREPNPEQPGYYMPHHAIFREHAATTKTRVVFNASASATGKSSLNNLLNPGPSLLPDLVGLLLRFREYQFALQADIRKLLLLLLFGFI